MRGLWLLLLGLALAAPLHADIIHLKNGGKIEGRITEEGFSYVRIETDKGFTEIDKDDIERIERKPWTPAKKKPSKKDEVPKLPPPPKITLEVVFREPILNFRMLFPAGWESGKAVEGVLQSFYGPKSESFEPRIDLLIDRESKDLGEAVKKENETLQGKATSIKVGPKDGREIFHEENGTKTLRVVVEGEKRSFVMRFTAPAAEFDKLGDAVNLSLRSLRIFPKHDLTKEERAEFTRRYNHAATLMNSKAYTDALKALDEVKKLVPDYPELYNLYGKTYSHLAKWKDATKAFQKAVKLDPDNFEYLYHATTFLTSRRKYRDAQKLAKRATEIKPWSEAAWINLGIVETRRRKYKEAKLAYRCALQINPKSIPATYNLGVLFEMQGKWDDAETAYRQVLHFAPDHKQAKAGIERVKKARK
jgi:tetratricopeptide (TPR) repeat protein